MGTIEGAVNIPLQQIRGRLGEFRKDQTIVLFCGVGLRAYMAERILRQNGFENVFNLSGGYKTWEYAVQKQSNEDIFEKSIIGKDDQIYSTDIEAGRKEREVAHARIDVKTLEVNAAGLQCPGPILELKKAINQVAQGDRVLETASDPGFAQDVKAWCEMTGNNLINLQQEKGQITALIEKGVPAGSASGPAAQGSQGASGLPPSALNTSLIMFSQDFDRALATLVIANGAASAGKKATVFFTFWGLNLIRKNPKPRVSKDFMGRMFDMMLPAHSGKLKLSKLNMGGMGVKMMRGRMKKLRIDSLEQMLKTAMDNGVRMVACTMSMDVMGVKKEELIDGVEVGGVATYLQAADQASNTLFI
ncbi:MAG: hypothetical protein CSA76_02085 [Spirochaetales bacterium]|nr:MAG: hypothetical protein CSA76_02085 [Spirochaetales bacterium]